LVFTASLLDIQYKKNGQCEDRPASSLVVFLDKARNEIASNFELLGW